MAPQLIHERIHVHNIEHILQVDRHKHVAYLHRARRGWRARELRAPRREPRSHCMHFSA